MTEAECTMMSTIHMYGLIFSLDGSGKETALKGIEAILEEAEQCGGEEATA